MSSYPPYAGPAGAVVTASGHRPDLRRPYVPAPWRTAPELGGEAGVSTAIVTDSATLPSIDAFLVEANDPGAEHATVPAIAGAGIAAAATVAGDQGAGAETHAIADDDSALRGEDWAMSDAAADVVSLAASLGAPDETRDPSPLLPPLPMWSDDDMMDIMPVARPADEEAAARLFGAEHGSTGQGEGAADERADGRSAPAEAIGGYHDAMPDADVPQGSEAAAAALETLARRIRDGELPIPGYAPGMGDAAALAAALASLLGLRR